MSAETLTAAVSRSYTAADLDAVAALLNLVSDHDGLQDTYTAAALAHEFADPTLDQARDLRLWEQDGQLVVFGQLGVPEQLSTPGEIDPYFYFRIHPAARTPDVAEAVRAWGFGQIQTIAAARGLRAHVITSARDHDTASRALFDQWGMAETRRFYRMHRDLAAPIATPALPPGYSVRPATAADLPAWVDCFNTSFVDHWNHHPLTLAQAELRLTDPDYRAELDLVAYASDGTMAGFAYCAVHPDKNARSGENAGYIHLLGTRRSHRGIGLGRALLLTALQTLRADRREIAVLGVDAENASGALQFYERAGFAARHTIIIYARRLDGPPEQDYA